MNKLRIKHAENEIEVEGSDEFIQKQLEDFYKKLASLPSRPIVPPMKSETVKAIAEAPTSKYLSPAEFYQQKSKGKTDGISKILIFGKYIEEFRGISEFSCQDINDLAKEAKFPKDIHAQYFTNGVKQGLLRIHGRSRYSLTLSAEAVVAAM